MSGPVQPPLTVETVDGTTSGRPITKIKVTNGTLSISGSTATIITGGGGGGGTIGGSIANNQVAVGSGTNTISGSSALTLNSSVLTVQNQIELSNTGAAGILKNSQNNQDLRFLVSGTGNVRIENQTTNTDSQLNVRGNGTGEPIISLSNDTKAITIKCDENQKLKVAGGTSSFIFDASSSTGGITWPDSTTQITANNFVGTVTSVGLTETGSALTITGSPITTSGTINIAGAGTSSEVILGDLSLGTLPTGTVTGTGIANQVSYWTSTTAQAGSSGLTYNPSTGDLTVGGYVEVGTKVTTPSGTGLTLETGGASSGSIVIADGANGQISITGNGTSVIKLGQSTNTVAVSNAYTLPNVVTTDNGYVLTAQTDGTTAWAASGGGGGGSPGGSDTQIQYNNGGSFGGISIMTYDDTATAEKIEIVGSSTETLMRIEQSGAGDALEVHDQASDTTVFKVDQSGHVQIGTTSETIGALRVKGYQGSSSVSGVSTYRISRLEDGVSGSLEITSSQSDSDMYISAGSTGADIILATRRNSPSTGNYENLRITSNGELGIEGSNFGTSGQVLTSGGPGAAVSWTSPSGGSSVYNPVLPATDIDTASANKLYIVSKMGLWGNTVNSYSTLSPGTDPLLWPFISPKSGDIGHISVSRAGGTTGTLGLAIYSDSNGIPGSKIGGDMSVSTTTQYTRVDTTPSSTVTLVQGTQYWLGVVETTVGNAAYTKEPSSGNKFVAPIDAATTRLDTTIVLSYGLKLNSSTSVLPSGPISATDLQGSTSSCIRFGIVYS